MQAKPTETTPLLPAVTSKPEEKEIDIDGLRWRNSLEEDLVNYLKTNPELAKFMVDTYILYEQGYEKNKAAIKNYKRAAGAWGVGVVGFMVATYFLKHNEMWNAWLAVLIFMVCIFSPLFGIAYGGADACKFEKLYKDNLDNLCTLEGFVGNLIMEIDRSYIVNEKLLNTPIPTGSLEGASTLFYMSGFPVFREKVIGHKDWINPTAFNAIFTKKGSPYDGRSALFNFAADPKCHAFLSRNLRLIDKEALIANPVHSLETPFYNLSQTDTGKQIIKSLVKHYGLTLTREEIEKIKSPVLGLASSLHGFMDSLFSPKETKEMGKNQSRFIKGNSGNSNNEQPSNWLAYSEM